MNGKKCPKCNFRKSAPSSGAVGDGSVRATLPAAVASLGPGGAFTYRKRDTGRMLEAWMCGSCGYTEFYAPRPTETLSSVRRAA